MRPVPLLVAVTLLWGSTFIVTKDILRQAPPLAYLLFRFGVAALVLLVLYGRKVRTRRVIVDGALLGLLNSCSLILQVIGQAFTTASKSAFITALNTPLVPVVSLLLYRTRPSLAQLLGVALATFGLGLLTYPTGGAEWNAGDLYTVGCATLFAIVIVEIARRSPAHGAAALTLTQIAAAALTIMVALGITKIIIATLPASALPEFARLEARPMVVTPRLVAEGLYMAIVCTVVTFLGQTWAMARMSAAHAAIVFALEPVFATLMAVGWEGAAEWPGSRGAFGACIVMLALLVTELPRRRARADA